MDPVLSLNDEEKLEPVKEPETFESKVIASSPEKTKQVATDWNATLSPEEKLGLLKSLLGEPETPKTEMVESKTPEPHFLDSRMARGAIGAQEEAPEDFKFTAVIGNSITGKIEEFLDRQN